MPSYNRHIQAIQSVKQILLQTVKKNICIIVLDNASTENYSTAFRKDEQLCAAIESGLVEIRRNPVNIGMSANFLRAFEIVQSDWLWLLSDDDDIHPNAIEIISNVLENTIDEYGFIKFSSSRSKPQSQIESIDNIEQFIDFNARSYDDFNGFIFISNGLYCVDQFKDLVYVGYQHANTYVPHFLMMATFMAEGGRMLVHQDEVVSYVVPEVGYSYGLLAGLGVGAPKSVLIDLSPIYAKRFYSLFFPHNDFKVIVDLFFHCKRDASKSVYRYLARNYIYLASYSRTWSQVLLLKFFVFLSYIPTLFDMLIHILESRSSFLKSQISEIKKRYLEIDKDFS